MNGRTVGFLVVALLAAAPAAAQALNDPTRPPNASAAGSPDAEPPPGMQLQSVLISQRRRLAIINGQTVALGDTVGEAKVVKITETEVVLQKGSETEVLKLFPGVDKQPVKRGPVRAQSASSQKSAQQGRPQ